MNYEKVSSELLRALRGRRSQQRLSQQLGYKSNIVYRWENGRCFPSAEVFFAISQKTGRRPQEAVDGFLRSHEGTRISPLTHRKGVLELVGRLSSEITITDLSKQLGKSRFVVSRWLDGSTAIRLPDLLHLVAVSSVRILDFLARFVDPTLLPSISAEWQALEASRRAATEHPWSHAVLRALELSDYAKLKRHRRGWISERVGITLEEEERGLEILASTSQIHWQCERWVARAPQTVDMAPHPADALKRKTFWMDVARARLAKGAPGSSGYNLFSISQRDLLRLRELQQQFFEQTRQIVSASEPCERVVLLSTFLLPLDGKEFELARR